MQIERSIEIERPVEEVFAFVLDARNDPRWCSKVISVAQLEGEEPGPGTLYEVVHRPIPLRPAREMQHRCLSAEPPHRISWREHDGHDVLVVSYLLEDLGRSTRFTQRSDAQLAAPRVLHPLMRAGIAHDIQGQLKALKTLLEGQHAGARESSSSAAT
jgi:uncharacterized membrane protein